jgi:hypothetical protein
LSQEKLYFNIGCKHWNIKSVLLDDVYPALLLWQADYENGFNFPTFSIFSSASLVKAGNCSTLSVAISDYLHGELSIRGHCAGRFSGVYGNGGRVHSCQSHVLVPVRNSFENETLIE